MNGRLEWVLSAAFPDQTVDAVERRETRPGNETVEVRFVDGGRAFLKIAVDGNRERTARDVAVTRYAASHTHVRVPQVLAADIEADPPYVATAPLTGTPVADHWETADTGERATLARTVGEALASVHVARFDRAGRIVGGDANALDLDVGPWTNVLCATVEERAGSLFADRFADLPGELLRHLSAHRDVLDRAPAALVHDDPRPENVFLDAGPGFIDWETALVGDPALDLYRAEAQYAERPGAANTGRIRDALRGGYRGTAGDLPTGFEERRNVYRAVTFLRTVRTFDLWAPRADEPTDDLAAWVREEFARRVGDVRTN